MMTGLDKITERILADAKERAREILERAQGECRTQAAAYAARADEVRDEITARAQQEGEDMIARARSSAAMTRRNILLEARARILDEAFDAARTEICDNDFGKYRELLIALLSCALLELYKTEQDSLALGDEIDRPEALEVLLCEADHERFGRSIPDGARRVVERRVDSAWLARLCLAEECADIEGGLILRCGEVEINCSVPVLLSRMRRELEGRLAAILFD